MNLASSINLNFLEASRFGNTLSDISNVLSVSVSKWSGIILTMSLTALAGLGIYRWSHSGKADNTAQDKDFEKVKARMTQAYAYVFGGLAATAVTAALAHATGLSRKILENSYFLIPATFVLSIGGLITTMLTDKENVKTKHIALAVFNIGMGLSLSPLCFLQRTILAQAAMITLGLGSLLTFSAYMAPDKSFLRWEGPLMMALTTLSIASFVASFFRDTAFHYGVDRMSLYGGLVIFSIYLMVDTQRLMDEAENQSDAQYDAINSSMSIYLDMVNIFIRVVRVLAENQKNDEKQAY